MQFTQRRSLHWKKLHFQTRHCNCLCVSPQGDPLPPSLIDLLRDSPISSVEDLKLLLQESNANGTNDQPSPLHTHTHTVKTDLEEVNMYVQSPEVGGMQNERTCQAMSLIRHLDNSLMRERKRVAVTLWFSQSETGRWGWVLPAQGHCIVLLLWISPKVWIMDVGVFMWQKETSPLYASSTPAESKQTCSHSDQQDTKTRIAVFHTSKGPSHTFVY